MEILYVCQSEDFLSGDFELAAYLARKTDSILVGAILENLAWEEVPIAESGSVHISTDLPQNEPVRVHTEELAARFKDACVCAEVRYRVHIERNRPLRELVAESRYADLIIVSATLSPDGKDKKVPTDFVSMLLEKAECPVIVGNERFEKISRLVFAYDGSLNAVFALKQFSYLFPQFSDTPITLVEAIAEEQECITEEHKLHEWLGMHYSEVELVTLKGAGTDQMLQYITGLSHVLIIMDGYGRGFLNRIFRPSLVAPVIDLIGMPVFIAHIPE